LSYLPLAHSFEKLIFVYGLLIGGSCGFYSGDTLKILDDLQALKPTIFISVPRLFNKVYEKIMAGAKDKPYFKQVLFNRALVRKRHYL